MKLIMLLILEIKYIKNTLDSLSAKIINRHTSLLPGYGGIYPVFWQMLNDEEYGGVIFALD